MFCPGHQVQAGQWCDTDHHVVVHRGTLEGLFEDLLDVESHSGAVLVTGHVHEAGHVATAVGVAAQEQFGTTPVTQAQNAVHDVAELVDRDLQEFFSGEGLQQLDEVPAVVAVGIEAGQGQDLGLLATQDGGLRDTRVHGPRREQAEESTLPDDGAPVVELLDPDVVQVLGAVDGGAGIGLGEHQDVGLTGFCADRGR